jgi:3-oxoacyl-[acyl-carrier-protein] synthase-3
VESGAAKRVLLCGGDKMSSIIDFEDRATVVLFGDGAGCAIIEMSDDQDKGVMDAILRIDGEGGKYLNMPAGGSVRPPTLVTVRNKEHYVFQDGQNVFKAAVKGMADVSVEIMKQNNLSSDDVKWLVPHQANLRIIDATARRMGLESEKVMINIEKYGNTTAGTIPILLSEWSDRGDLVEGDKIVLASFGAGFTWGAMYLVWHLND